MSADLGARLQRAGLITREQLAETLATAPLHGSALVRALLKRGVPEDALVGYFVAEGFGPLLGPNDLHGADPALVSRIPVGVLREFAVLPIRAAGDQWVVAMVAPTERHVVAEVERIAGVKVIPAAARWSDLRAALADVGASKAQERDDDDDEGDEPPRPPSEPPVIELVRRRPSHAPPDTGYRSAPPAAVADVKVTLDPDDAVPLVRHKPVTRTSSAPPPEKIIAKSFGPPRETTPQRGLWGRSRQDTRPVEEIAAALEASASASSAGSAPAPTALEIATASAVDALPAAEHRSSAGHTPSVAPKAIVVPRPSDPYVPRKPTLPPAAPASPARLAPPTADAASASSSPGSDEAAGTSAVPSLLAHAEKAPPSIAPPSITPDLEPGPRTEPAPPPDLVEATFETKLRPPATDEVAPDTHEAPETPRASTTASAITSEAPASQPPTEPRPTPDERWDVPPATPVRAAAAPAARNTNKLSSRAARELVSVKAPLGDVRGVLASIRQANDRDDVVRLGLDGALSVSRSAVFFALRKGLLKGWDGIGSGVTQDSARNLWIPTSTASLFQRVVESGVGYFGPYGNAIADGLFRAAVGSRGGDLALLPIKVSGKVVGLLACDDVRAGPQGQQRLELLATAIEEAFGRIIVKQKQG